MLAGLPALFPEEPHQALRLRRSLLAAAGGLGLTVVSWLLLEIGELRLSEHAFAALFGGFWLVNLGFLAIIRSGWNQRLTDPSLTLPQLLWAVLFTLLVAYFVDALRHIMLLLVLLAMVFGAFRLGLRGFALAAAAATLGYGLVLNLIAADPTRVLNRHHALIEWICFTLTAIGLAWLGRELSGLREKLRRRNAELEVAVTRLRHHATTDGLTGCHNRRHMLDILAQHKRRADRGEHGFALGFVDLDQFKTVNDRFGHAAGDAVLREFAELARQRLRGLDVLGRIGGEEFLFLVSDGDVADAAAVGERLRELVAQHHFDGLAPDHRQTVSVGVTAYLPEESLDAALGRADKALYQAKAAGRNALERR